MYSQVQVRHDICGRMPRCVCAVAARAGQDVFTIDFCNGKEIINFPLCNENSLKVIKIYDKVYKVSAPFLFSCDIISLIHFSLQIVLSLLHKCVTLYFESYKHLKIL